MISESHTHRVKGLLLKAQMFSFKAATFKVADCYFLNGIVSFDVYTSPEVVSFWNMKSRNRRSIHISLMLMNIISSKEVIWFRQGTKHTALAYIGIPFWGHQTMSTSKSVCLYVCLVCLMFFSDFSICISERIWGMDTYEIYDCHLLKGDNFNLGVASLKFVGILIFISKINFIHSFVQ